MSSPRFSDEELSVLDTVQDAMAHSDTDLTTRSGRVQWAIREALAKRNQSELEELLGVDRSIMYRWSVRAVKAPRKGLDKLESVLGLRAGWLADGVGEPFADRRPTMVTKEESPLLAAARRSKEEALLLELLDELVQGLKRDRVGTGEEIAELRKGVEEWLETSANRTNGNKGG